MKGRGKVLLTTLCENEKCILNCGLHRGNWVIWKTLCETLACLFVFPPQLQRKFYFHSSFTASCVFDSKEAFLFVHQKPPEALSGWVSYSQNTIYLYKRQGCIMITNTFAVNFLSI